MPERDQDSSRVYCPYCPKDFKFQKGLKEHFRDRCGKTQKMFQCGVCRTEFHHEESLLDHVSIFHTGQKRHKCEFCPEAYFYRKDLKAHFDDDVKVSPSVYKNNSFVSFVSASCGTHGSMYCISFGIST